MAQKINLEQSSDAIQGFMSRQWYSLTGSRAFGVEYNNPRNWPKEVHVSIDHAWGTAGRQVRCIVNGVIVFDSFAQSATNNTRVIIPVQFTVPPNGTYRIDVVAPTASIFRWAEMY